MKITKATFYLTETESQRRQVRFPGRGGIDKVPPGLSGLFTRSDGFGPEEERQIEFTADAPAPMYRLQLRLHTDGPLDAYSDWASGYSAGELEWEAKMVLARLMPMIIGVDAFDREYIWQRLWYAQRFFHTGRQALDTIDRMLWDLASRHARQPIYRLLGGSRESIPAYAFIGGRSIDDIVESAMAKRGQGFIGGKDHWYRGVERNTEMASWRSTITDGSKSHCRTTTFSVCRPFAKPSIYRSWHWNGSVTSAASPSMPPPTSPSVPPTSSGSGALASPGKSRWPTWPKAWAYPSTAVTRT